MKRVFTVGVGLLLMLGTVGLADERRNQDGPPEARPQLFGMATGFESGYLGVQLGEVNSEIAKRLSISEERGAHVVEVISDSPAARAGLQKDDVIVSWNGERVESAIQVSRHVRETPSGRSVKLGVIRVGRQIDLEVKLGERSGRAWTLAARPATARVMVRPRARVGLGLQSLTAQLAEYFGLSKRSGALVVSVSENSAAARAGLKAGDVILSVEGQPVDSPSDVTRALRGKQEGAVEVKVVRDKRERSFSLQIEKGSTSSLLVEPAELIDVEVEPLEIVIPRVDLKPIQVPTIHLPKIEIPRIELPQITIPKIRAFSSRRVVV